MTSNVASNGCQLVRYNIIKLWHWILIAVALGSGFQRPSHINLDDNVCKLPNDKWRIVIASWTVSCVAWASMTGWALNTPEETRGFRGSPRYFEVAADMSLLLLVWSRRVPTLVVRAMPDACSSNGLSSNESIGVEDDRRRQRKGDSTGNQHGSAPVEGACAEPKTYQWDIRLLIEHQS